MKDSWGSRHGLRFRVAFGKLLVINVVLWRSDLRAHGQVFKTISLGTPQKHTSISIL